MIVAGAHATMVASMAGKFVPLAESVLPMLKKPLRAELQRLLPQLSKHIRSDLVPVMHVYRRPLSASAALALKPLEEEARQSAVHEIEALIAALKEAKPMTVATFAKSLIDQMVAAIELHGKFAAEKEAQPSDADYRVIVTGDTAFRTLMYFLEIAGKVMREVQQPKSLYSVR